MKGANWIGRMIVSKYGLVCDVVYAQDDGTLKCCARHNGRVWEWSEDTVSLVTREGEILDWKNGEIYGKIRGNKDWDLYEDDKCRKISQEEVEREFSSRLRIGAEPDS